MRTTIAVLLLLTGCRASVPRVEDACRYLSEAKLSDAEGSATADFRAKGKPQYVAVAGPGFSRFPGLDGEQPSVWQQTILVGTGEPCRKLDAASFATKAEAFAARYNATSTEIQEELDHASGK